MSIEHLNFEPEDPDLLRQLSEEDAHSRIAQIVDEELVEIYEAAEESGFFDTDPERCKLYLRAALMIGYSLGRKDPSQSFARRIRRESPTSDDL